MDKYALIGCGAIAARHAESILNVGKLVAVCDVVAERADAFAAQYNARPYYTIDDLLKNESEVTVLSICTPNGLHAEHTIKALQNGKHVLCEKPLCITREAASQMIDTAYFFRRNLFVVKQNRFNPPVVYLKQLLQQNMLGTIYSFQINGFWNRPQAYYTGNWKGTKHLDGGILYTQFSHFIDLLYWLLGDVKTVSAIASTQQPRRCSQIEDTIIAQMELESGALGSLHFTTNAFGENREGSFTIFAENGTIKIGGQYLNMLEWHAVKGKRLPDLPAAAAANQYGFYTGSMSNHAQVYTQLHAALHGAPNALPQAADAVKTIEIIEKIYAAAARP